MEFSDLSVIFTYFDTTVGPTTFMVKPPIDSENLEQINSLLDIYSEYIHFEYNFHDIHTYNTIFPIDSLNARGGSIDCMLSIWAGDGLIQPQEEALFSQLIEKYIKEFQNLPEIDILFLKNAKENPNFASIKSAFEKIFLIFYDEVNSIIIQSNQIIPTFIPGFIQFSGKYSSNDIKSWLGLDNIPKLLQRLLLYICLRKFETAFSEWEKIKEDFPFSDIDRVKYYLIGSYICQKLEKIPLANQFAEKAFEFTKYISDSVLYIDSVLNLIQSAAYTGMIMVFETAFKLFDASLGLSDWILRNFDEYSMCLKLAQCQIPQEMESLPHSNNYLIRKAIIEMMSAKLNLLLGKKDRKEVNFEKIKEQIEKSFDILKDFSFIELLIENRILYSLFYESIEENASAQIIYDEALQISQDLPPVLKAEYTAWINQRKGWNAFHSGNLPQSVDLFNQSLFNLKCIQDLSKMDIFSGKTNMRIGFLLSFQKEDLKKIEKYYLQAKEKFEIHGEKTELARLYYLIGDLYKKKGVLSEALDYYDKCENLAKNNDDEECLAISLARKAKIAVEILDLNLALYLYKKALNLFEKINHPQFLGIIYGEIGGIYHAIDKLDNALHYYEKGLNSFKKEGNELQSYWILYKLVLLFLETDIEKTRFYAEKLFEMRKTAKDDIIIQTAKIVEGLLLSLSGKHRDQMKAVFLLEQVTEESIIDSTITHAALLHLCEFLVTLILTSNDETLILDLRKHLGHLIVISREFHVRYELLELSILYAKISITQFHLDEAAKVLKDSINIAVHLNNQKLKKRVSSELKFLSYMKKEQGYDEFKKLTLGERFKRIHLDKEIRDFIRNFNI